MVRTIQLGPEQIPASDISALFGGIWRIRFQVPAGGTVTYISIMAPVDTPRTWVRAVLYQTRRLLDVNFEGEKAVHQLIPEAFSYGSLDFPTAVIWEGRHRVDDNFEYTLEILVYDGTGVSAPIWKAMALVEVDE